LQIVESEATASLYWQRPWFPKIHTKRNWGDSSQVSVQVRKLKLYVCA
jgi:hypothetical protein